MLLLLATGPALAQVCGNGVLEQGEECDPGGPLHEQGNPANPTCGGGGTGIPGSDCFYAFTCCKFNCQFANPGPCFDGNECTTFDECDNVGNCLGNGFAATGAPCGDSSDDACDAADTCDGSGTCNTNLAPAGTACGEPAASECDAADVCNGAGLCTVDLPPFGHPAPVQCADGNVCTADVCDGAGGCANPAGPAGVACGDPSSSACDDPDTCDAGGTCVTNHAVDGAPCDDGAFCTATDTCQGGACVGTGDPCAAGAPCQDHCNETTHDCAAPPGGDCDPDDDPCSGTATCDAGGACIPGPALAEGDACDDGLDCTLLDSCTGGLCEGTGAYAAERRLKVSNLAVVGSDLIAFDVGGLASIGKRTDMADGTLLMGDKVKLLPGASAFDVRANTLKVGSAAEIRGSSGPAPLPVAPATCGVRPEIECVGPPVTVLEAQSDGLAPGVYGDLELKTAASLTLAPGHYEFCEIKTGKLASIIADAGGPVDVEVVGNVRVRNGGTLAPAPGAARPTFYVHGRAARFGASSFVQAHVVAPEGSVKYGGATVVDGTTCTRNLKGAWNVRLTCVE